jgi:integrase
VVRRGYLTRAAALAGMREALGESERGEFVDPSRQVLGGYLDEWLAGLRLEASTIASYRIIIRCHVKPYIGDVPLASLTTARIDALYRQLEREGRRDTKGELAGKGLGLSTVRYVHTVLSAALAAAVSAGQLRANPAARAHPPTGKQVKAQQREMQPWTAGQLAAFLGWSKEHSSYHVLWLVLAMTGMRRGEALGLRWRDVDLDAGTIAVRRGARMIRYKGEPGEIHEGPTKGHKARGLMLTPPRWPSCAAGAGSAARWLSSSPATTPWCSAPSRTGSATPSMSPRRSRPRWRAAAARSATARCL